MMNWSPFLYISHKIEIYLNCTKKYDIFFEEVLEKTLQGVCSGVVSWSRFSQNVCPYVRVSVRICRRYSFAPADFRNIVLI